MHNLNFFQKILFVVVIFAAYVAAIHFGQFKRRKFGLNEETEVEEPEHGEHETYAGHEIHSWFPWCRSLYHSRH